MSNSKSIYFGTALLIGLLAVAVSHSAVRSRQPDALAGQARANRPKTAKLGDTWVNPKDGAVMVYIPAGPFKMGDDDDQIKDFSTGNRNNPGHTVTLSGYWIYRDLVTVGMYKKFCNETGHKMPHEPEYPAGNKFNPGWSKEDHPIIDVSWNDLTAPDGYLKWAGVALPTEAQWEKAARGTEGRKYPFGDQFDPAKVWCSKSSLAGSRGTQSVGRYGISLYSGCTDMAGNVWQWTADLYDDKFWTSRPAESADPANIAAGETGSHVVRGGAWYFFGPQLFRSASRNAGNAVSWGDGNGFRCSAVP